MDNADMYVFKLMDWDAIRSIMSLFLPGLFYKLRDAGQV